MGGGSRADMRAAAAGFGTQSTRRGATIVPPVEQPVRKASIPVSAVISSSSASQNVMAASDVALVQRPSWEMDDREFADGDELVMSAGEPMPRVVFGGAPSFQEAKEATIELKDALDKVYLSSPKSSGCAEQVTTDQVAGMSLFSNTDSETKACLIVETNPSDSIPKHALQAFKFLSGSPEAQNVVASIACDQSVWNAMMQNPDLKRFNDSQQTVEEFQDPASPKKFDEDLSDHSSQSGDSKNGFMKDMMQKIKFRVSQSGDSKNGFMKDTMQKIKFRVSQSGDSKNGFMKDKMENIKFRVVDMVTNVSKFSSYNIFGPSLDANGDTKSTVVDMKRESIMGLVVLVIMVVVFKRV